MKELKPKRMIRKICITKNLWENRLKIKDIEELPFMKELAKHFDKIKK